MKAVIWTRYGPPDVLQVREVDTPTPKEGEIRVRIHATTVTAGDCELRSLRVPLLLSLPMRAWIGAWRPRPNTIPGTELAGEVEAVGEGVTRFQVGDRVFGSTGMSLGANAEYLCLSERPGESNEGVARMPANMSYAEAATIPFGGRDALHFLRLGNLRPGHQILINGAGGSIGTFAVQLAKGMGAEVTAVDSAPKLDMLRSLGADHVVDYGAEDWTARGEVYDVVFDVIGMTSFFHSSRAIRPDGTYLLANPVSQMAPAMWTRITTRKRVVMQAASGTVEDLDYLRGLIEAGRLRTVIDRTYPLDQIVDAHRYVETGQKQGNVAIAVVQENDG